jgi:phage protein D
MRGEQYNPPRITIEIDGRRMSIDDRGEAGKFIEDILQVAVEESLHMPSMCTLVINNDYFPGRREQDRPWKHDDLLKIGKTIKIELQSSTTARFQDNRKKKPIFEGEITGIECHFTDESQAPIVIRAYDISHRLHRGRYNRSFQNMTDSDIVKKIAKEVGIEKVIVDSSDYINDYIFQENQTNMEFLRERAFRIGFELYVQDNCLYFRKSQKGKSLELKWLKDLNSFRVRVSSAEQVSSVEVRGWDYQQKRAIVATAQNEQVITRSKNGSGREVSNKFKVVPKMIVVDRPVFSAQEANQIAQAICNELGGEFVCADARGEGNPEIRVGKVVNLKEMGRYDGQYYITETRHLYHKRVYTTEFTVRGLRGGNLLTLLSPQTRLQPGQTLLVGVVTDNKDPKGWGRVKVKFPTLTEEHTSNWARIVALGAADNRGFDCLPEVNDEVLIGFEHGDIHRPYVIGGVWNGKDKPPEIVDDSVQNGKVRLRTFKTRTGHILQFVEEDRGSSQDGIYIETAGGHQIRLNDSARQIEIKTSGGHQVKMDDRGQSISVSSTGNLSLKAQGNIEIKANGTITVEGRMIYLN